MRDEELTMRNLTPEEIAKALDNNGEPDEGCVAVEATVAELAKLGVSTVCGSPDNRAFQELSAEGFGKRRCRGWYLEKDFSKTGGSDQTVWGMFHIEVSEEEAERVERVVSRVGGSLRASGLSMYEDGFYEFEIE
jgi:hypothetical protein